MTKATLWLAAEVLLTVSGLDNLADYSEFIFGREFSTGPAITAYISKI
ncbi:MAG TPA: hypothetical protein V6D29_15915 [Leptolyngbyaceae cyanobacterium]